MTGAYGATARAPMHSVAGVRSITRNPSSNKLLFGPVVFSRRGLSISQYIILSDPWQIRPNVRPNSSLVPERR